MSAPCDHRRVRVLAQEVAGPRREIEAGFVAAGTHLGKGFALLDSLGGVFESLAGALAGAEVDEARARLDEIATETGALARVFDDERRHLLRLAEVVASAAVPIDDLIRSAKTMGIVSINARVTAVGLVEDSADLQIFSSDIATLSGSAGRAIHDLALVYGQLDKEVARATQQRAQFEAEHANTLADLLRSLSGTLAALDEQRRRAAESSRETGGASRGIAARIASAVMALQVGDATRQRLEHVEGGLDAVVSLARGLPALGQMVPPGGRGAAGAAIMRLQARQLAGAAAAFGAGVARAQGDLQALASDAAGAMARARSFRGHDRASGSVVAELGDQLRVAVSILHAFEMARSRIDRVAATVQDTVRAFLGHVRAVQDIEAEMRLVSLNATIRCAQLGPRAAALSIIASQLRELTGETVTAAEAAMSLLEESSALAGAFGAASGGAGGGRIGRLEGQARLALEILGNLDRRVAGALRQLNADGPKAIMQLEAAARALAGQSAHAERLDGVAALLDACAGAEPRAATAPDGPLSPLLERLYAQYSMKDERDIHEAIHPREAPGPEETIPGEDAELEDFLL